jgi:hypothetical protein
MLREGIKAGKDGRDTATPGCVPEAQAVPGLQKDAQAAVPRLQKDAPAGVPVSQKRVDFPLGGPRGDPGERGAHPLEA